MKPTIIHSKWHKIADPMKVNVALSVNDYHGLDGKGSKQYVDDEVVRDMFTLYDELPKYVMYDDIVDLVFDSGGALHKSIKAMMKADLVHLPFPEMLIEFKSNKEITGTIGPTQLDGKNMPTREFVWLGNNNKGYFKERGDYPFFAVPMTLVEPPGRLPTIILSASCVVAKYVTEDDASGVNQLGLQFTSYLCPYMKTKLMTAEVKRGLLNGNQGSTMWSASCAITATVALLRTKGVVQDHIEAPAKLNKSRAAAGKPLIRDHTVIRIGHLYDRQGNAVEYKASGRKMPVHWRAGHLRNQRFGPALSKSYEVFIEPMLINYVEGGEKAPVPMKEVTV